jgi:transcriptional regulator with XRE-family HTH domain
MKDTLGKRIRMARVYHEMSQAELARHIGISTTSMNQIESGKTPDPAASRIKGIAEVLGVSADYLLGLEDNATLQPPVRRRPAKAGAV